METVLTDKVLTACARYLMAKMKSSSRTAKEKGQKNGRKKRRVISVDINYLKTLLIKNNFRCPHTGHQFPIYDKATKYKEADTKKLVNPLMLPSADRINSDLDYVAGNIEITTLFYNNGKGDKTKEQALEVLNIKMKNMSIANKTFSDDLLLYFAELGRFDLCEKYFTIPIKSNNKRNKTQKKQNSDTYSYYKNKKDKFDKLVVHVNDVIGKKCLSDIYPKAKDLVSSKIATELIESNTTIYAISREGTRGLKYYIDK